MFAFWSLAAGARANAAAGCRYKVLLSEGAVKVLCGLGCRCRCWVPLLGVAAGLEPAEGGL